MSKYYLMQIREGGSRNVSNVLLEVFGGGLKIALLFSQAVLCKCICAHKTNNFCTVVNSSAEQKHCLFNHITQFEMLIQPLALGYTYTEMLPVSGTLLGLCI